MLRALSRLFRRNSHKRPRLTHPQLGLIEFDPKSGEWQTIDSAIYHGGIPGVSSGPDPDAVRALSDRLLNIDRYWDACEQDLVRIAGSWSSVPTDVSVKTLFRLAALSLYPTYWEICFETRPEYKWLYIGMQFEGENLVSNTIDT
jgi:hypothetical protein